MGKLYLVKGMIENNLKYCRETEELTQKELGFRFGGIILGIITSVLAASAAVIPFEKKKKTSK